ncbi:MAG: type II/IV secretion system protein [Phycisphaeraceae bacterium]|nr:type II/IV secretion system protein [Phycisphaeraceae bacterium]
MFLRLIPHEFARRHLVLSEGATSREDGTLVEQLLIAPSTRPAAVFNVGVRLGRTVETRTGDPEAIAAAIDAAYAQAAADGTGTEGKQGGAIPRDLPIIEVEGSVDVAGDLAAAVRAAEGDLLSTSGKSPVVRLVDLILFEALLRGASDVHIQPVGGGGAGGGRSDENNGPAAASSRGDRTLVRFRLDGSLHTVRDLPGALASAVVSRIKVMARMDVAERRAPQDGRASVSIGTGGVGGGGGGDSAARGRGRRVDLRISTLPSTYGERVVLRLLDPSRSPHLLSFAALGMPPEVEQKYLAQVNRASGIVLSTGPTGSGKTTTLYATLAWLSAHHDGASGGTGCELNMMTIEDPVEYDLSAIGAIMRGNPRGGVATSTGGRGAISQTQVDPKKNVTFATGLRHILRQDPDVIMVGEIRDEETARMAVQASLTGHLVLSTLHTNDAAGAVARLLDLGVEPFLVASSLSAMLAQRLVRRVHGPCAGRGCAECLSTGFKGRLGVFELLTVDATIRSLINQRAPAAQLKSAGQNAGMVTLREAGEAFAAQGLTTLAEVGRVIDLLDDEEVVA